MPVKTEHFTVYRLDRIFALQPLTNTYIALLFQITAFLSQNNTHNELRKHSQIIIQISDK